MWPNAPKVLPGAPWRKKQIYLAIQAIQPLIAVTLPFAETFHQQDHLLI